MTRKNNVIRNNTIIIIIAVLILVFLSQYDPIKELVSTGFAALLVIITAIYAMTTNEILKDSQESRTFAYIEKQLDLFYMPLEHFLNDNLKVLYHLNSQQNNKAKPSPQKFLEYMSDSENDHIDYGSKLIIHGGEPADRIYDEIKKHRHFADVNSRKTIDKFIEMVDSKEIITIYKMENFVRQLDTCLNNDIEKLTDRLYELTR